MEQYPSGTIDGRKVYFDSRKENDRSIDRAALALGGWALIDTPTRNKKETLDKQVIVDVLETGMMLKVLASC